MAAAALVALIGVVHVHHAPSHDSQAPFEEVLAGAQAAGLDFLVLTEHYDSDRDGPLPGGERAGIHPGSRGRPLLVLVGVEVGTADGHLLAFGVSRAPAGGARRAREVVDRIHAEGGFAVVPHPFTHGGFRGWDAPFDGLEVHNNASAFRSMVGPLLPIRLVRFALDRHAVLDRMLERPARELDRWESLLRSGRRVVGFSGADAHANVSILGWRLDPYAQQFGLVRTHCPDVPLEPDPLWQALREGRCSIRYRIHEGRDRDGVEVGFPSGRVEIQLDGGRRVLEIRNPPPASPPQARPHSRAAP